MGWTLSRQKGATVDTMALAVEGSAVVLIGVSRAYKESSNCRMECQYAHQKKKAIVPLKLTDGYEADGWFGLLLGSSLGMRCSTVRRCPLSLRLSLGSSRWLVSLALVVSGRLW